LIYLDTSVALAQLLAEDRRPPVTLWEEELIASRLLEYEVWVRLNARQLAASHRDLAERLLSRVALVEMVPPVLSRALESFPVELRTLDALHLATIDFLRQRRQQVRLATYDDRMRQVARALDIPLVDLE
jgi:predicted nucleic acid-binding protein